jgi:hypothetical protein
MHYMQYLEKVKYEPYSRSVHDLKRPWILNVVTNMRYSSSLRLGHTAVLLSGHKRPLIFTTRMKYCDVDTKALF